MTWRAWANELKQSSQQAVADLLRGGAEIFPHERATPHEFLLAVLPRRARVFSEHVFGSPDGTPPIEERDQDLLQHLDSGLSEWLLGQRRASPPTPRKLSAYAAMVCEALQWPLYFDLWRTLDALRSDRSQWLRWLGSLPVSAYRDPEYDYWQVLAARQTDDALQSIWQSFVIEAGRSRSFRYLNLGLLALAKLPLSDEDSLRNLRLQVQVLVNRYQSRRRLGAVAMTELADSLRGVLARNPSLNSRHYQAFLQESLSPLGENLTVSVLSLLGLGQGRVTVEGHTLGLTSLYKMVPPGSLEETERVLEAIRRSSTYLQAWTAMSALVAAHEAYMRKSGDVFHFARTLDRTVRAFCEKYALREPESQARVLQWIHTALRMEADEPRRWMLWELALHRSGHKQRAEWVLWEMTRRFPENVYCRVELSTLLADLGGVDNERRAKGLLRQVLQLEPENAHALATLAHLAIERHDWEEALARANDVLRLDNANEVGAVLLAEAYARRNWPGDLQLAIDHLRRFVQRYPGNFKAEERLRRLSGQKGLPVSRSGPLGDLDSSSTSSVLAAEPETDDAWCSFAQSIQAWVTESASDAFACSPEDEASYQFVPLPKALLRAVVCQQWDSRVVENYEISTQHQFPLEIRLWRYLQALHSAAGQPTERERARQELVSWLGTEIEVLNQDNPSWSHYLDRKWKLLEAASEEVTLVTEWLTQALDRYQPLPAPLLA